MPDVSSSAPADVRLWVAFDVHKLSIVAAVLPPDGGRPEVTRLESHTKVVKRLILIDEDTRRGLGDDIAVEPQGEVLMKGKTEPTTVYAVLTESLVAESA